MSTLIGTPHVSGKLRTAAEISGIALSSLIAVGVAVLFLAVIGASRSRPVPHQQSAGYVTPINHASTRARPTPADIQTTPAHDSPPAHIRAEQSHEAVR